MITRRKLLVCGLGSLLLSLASVAIFALVGSRIDENGLLIEPFWLIPGAWFWGVLGAMLLLWSLLK